MIKIVRSLPRFDGRSSFGTWAYRIAMNASLDELRKRERRPGLTLVDDGRAEPLDDLAGERIERVTDRMLLDAALDELADDLRAAVVLRDVANLDYAEIATALDIPIGTVKSRISRGRSALADLLRLDRSEPAGNRTGTDERPTDDT